MSQRLAWLVAVGVAMLLPSVSRLSADEKNATKEITVKRRSELSAEALRQQLQLVPELGFDQGGANLLYAPLQKVKDKAVAVPFDYGPVTCAQLATRLRRPDLTSLPWRTGQDSTMGKESAERLDVLSTKLRGYLRSSVPSGDKRPDPEKLRELIQSGKAVVRGRAKGTGKRESAAEWQTPEALPTLLQMLQPENTPIRSLLIDLLADIDGKEASVAIAKRALFDLSPKLREQAILVLSERPAKEYQQTLLEGLRYPWPPVADHAAEALAALRLKETMPELVNMLREPDPRAPFVAQQIKEELLHGVRELVRINHLSNCVLCHAPSTSKEDLVRGRIPLPGEEPPPLYYAERIGIFVRADITFLRQDFSVPQPVLVPLKWPGNQRYDYFIRTRKATPQEVKLFQALPKDPKTPAPHREAMLFALREIAGEDHGNRYDDWIQYLRRLENSKE